MEATYLATYPIKSCYRVETDSADVEPWGLVGDRRWVVLDAAGTVLTQRRTPSLGRIRPRYTEKGLLLSGPGVADLDVRFPDGDPVALPQRHGPPVDAVPAGPEADAWVSTVVGEPVRLVYLDDPTQRWVNPEYGRPDDRVSFADAYPVLLANAASLDAVNGWLAEEGEPPVEMTRFRPNIVVTGPPAWEEDRWIGGRIRVGDVSFRVVKPCDRCVFTTIDPETGEKGRQPLRILGEHRRFPGGLMFAVNLIPDGRGTIAVGDPVTVQA